MRAFLHRGPTNQGEKTKGASNKAIEEQCNNSFFFLFPFHSIVVFIVFGFYKRMS